MTVAKALRDIIKIDEEKCDGCGACVLGCAEGAIQVIDGKAKLISEIYCDGLGACIGECPQGALSIEKRESDQFDEAAVEEHLHATKKEESLPCGCPSSTVQQFDRTAPRVEESTPCACPSATVRQFGGEMKPQETLYQKSTLAHWPVQLTLVPPGARFLQGADVLLAAHCAPFAYGNFHQDFIKDHTVLCACPKLDDIRAHQQKLAEILKQSDVKSLTVVEMEVPCCGGLHHIAQQAISTSGKNIPLKVVTIGMKGDLLN